MKNTHEDVHEESLLYTPSLNYPDYKGANL